MCEPETMVPRVVSRFGAAAGYMTGHPAEAPKREKVSYLNAMITREMRVLTYGANEVANLDEFAAITDFLALKLLVVGSAADTNLRQPQLFGNRRRTLIS